jgi:hypothetical protein
MRASQFQHENGIQNGGAPAARAEGTLMPRIYLSAIGLALSLLLIPATSAAPAPAKSVSVHKSLHKSAHRPVRKKRRVTRHWRGYGFLPGYRPPEVIERERAEHYWRSGPHFYGPAWPRFYRGRWNGGGFGPCWTQTPIGYMWNCGR